MRSQLQQDSRICIVGMGFVGLTLAVVLAERGFHVLGLESDVTKLGLLKNYQVHFHEEGLAARCKAVIDSGALVFEHPSTQRTLDDYQVFFLTVGTPLDESGAPRMDMVERSAKYVGELMPDGAMVILRSTVKLGTTRKVVLPILESFNKTFDLCYCSERTLEGRALEELATNPQIIGSLNVESAARAEQIFNRLTDKVIHTSSLEAAELIKLLDNSYRDYSFAFGNEVALICEAAGLNASEVIKTANWEYSRTNIPRPGFVGGPCLEKDPHILCSSLQPFGFVPRLIKLARAQNEYLPIHVVENIVSWVENAKIENPSFRICGLAFKGVPETDDIRGTPAKILIKALKQTFSNSEFYAHDFICSKAQMEELGLTVAPKLDVDVDIMIIVNDHPGYTDESIKRLGETGRKHKLIVDCCGVLKDPSLFTDKWTEYMRLGDNG